MTSQITGKEYALKDIFSDSFDFYIPNYQRPYAWTEEETGTLFDDLYDFYNKEHIKLDADKENYFLGSIVLVKKDEKTSHADVIDGQQRLTTLTILLAAIMHLMQDSVREDLKNNIIDATTAENKNRTINKLAIYIRDPGNEFEDRLPKSRLQLREKDQKFFEKYIQNINLDDLLKLDPKSLPDESQFHIQANCKLIIARLKNARQAGLDINDFCKFLINRCYLVAVHTSTEDSAFRVFAVMNSRGLNLLPIDIIKADIIGKIDANKQKEYTEKWEELENLTTRDGFNEVFTHTRMIFAKTKAQKTLLEEFRSIVMKNRSPEDVIDKIIEPYSEMYLILKNHNYVASRSADKINGYIVWLNRIDFSDWMPVAMKFFAEHKDDSEYILWFVQKLERLSAFLHITARDVNKRIDRYGIILREMDNRPQHNLNNKLDSIELSNEEKKAFLKALNDDIYDLTSRRRNYVIQRLDSFVSDGAASYDAAVLTIEHVLPQTVAAGSEWEQLWPDATVRDMWLNRIANLVPLTRKHNSAAQNYDFAKKKETYFKSKNNGTTSYALTTQVLNVASWTLTIVEQRQKALLDAFKKHWDLDYIEDQQTTSFVGDNSVLMLRNSSNDAQLKITSDGYVLLKGSAINEKTSVASIGSSVAAKRAKYMETSVRDLKTTEDIIFTSSSAASDFVTGYSTSGLAYWMDKDGKTLKEILEQKEQ